jgi:histone-lysine N-methyltransferase SETD3
VPKAFPWEEKEDEVVLFADRAYKKFEQVFISYGPKSNADLLLLYGFALDRNPFNSVDLAVGASKDDALYAAKERFARGAGRDVSSAAFPLYADRFPDELVQFLRMACATEDHLGARPLDDPDNYVDILSLDNELAVLDTIRDACDAAVAAYPAKSGDDVPDAFLSRNQRMAKRLVNTEKRILLKTIAAVERKSNELLAAPSFAFERRQPDVLSNFK